MVRLSVVMSVYNGATSLEATLRTILAQAAAQDVRVHVISQENAGLTRALIRGCDAARAPFIARHDAGDRSHPERFARQLALIEQGHVLVACATRYVDPEGNLLYHAAGDGETIRQSLLHDPMSRIQGMPHHAAAMFRRDAYVAAGGYRPQFRVAQDLDLWIRLAALGTIAISPDVCFESTIDPSGISSVARDRQILAGGIAVALRDGGNEHELLAHAARLVRPRRTSRRRAADGHYFLARCLLAQGNPAWRARTWQALRRWPFHARAWWTLLSGH
jgi:hypothetical protein